MVTLPFYSRETANGQSLNLPAALHSINPKIELLDSALKLRPWNA